jgi:hypothetical protein
VPRPNNAQYWIVTGREFRDVARELRLVDAALPKEFRKKLRLAAKPLMEKAKAELKAMPVKGRDSSGLRRRVARGVKLFLPRSNTSIRIVTSMKDRSEVALPRGLDTRYGWRHPVFGDREEWVRQPGYSWFREPISEGRDDLKRALTEVLEEARDRIADAGS